VKSAKARRDERAAKKAGKIREPQHRRSVAPALAPTPVVPPMRKALTEEQRAVAESIEFSVEMLHNRWGFGFPSIDPTKPLDKIHSDWLRVWIKQTRVEASRYTQDPAYSAFAGLLEMKMYMLESWLDASMPRGKAGKPAGRSTVPVQDGLRLADEAGLSPGDAADLVHEIYVRRGVAGFSKSTLKRAIERARKDGKSWRQV